MIIDSKQSLNSIILNKIKNYYSFNLKIVKMFFGFSFRRNCKQVLFLMLASNEISKQTDWQSV
jgi:hypothetical protein